MRFHSDGPSIPDLLLERRDQGRVVFLCGAGVSLDAGMPNFRDLTKYVIDFFDPPESSPIATAFRPWLDEEHEGAKESLDHIFNLLHQEYGRDEVNALVAKRLHTGDQIEGKTHHHELIVRISSNQGGKPQIVTTNFDHLFEAATDKDVNIHKPPSLPNIELGIPLSGVTYLHGRLEEPNSQTHPYTLGSMDFGRAYLSEAWATNFIRSLLEHYTVVLLGYSADDLPVRYLLQGLNHDERSDRSNLYAFDRGLPEEIETKWRDKGVTAIPYKEHADLWETLEAWAERADNPRKWRSNVIEMAKEGPRRLSAHERGQVVHVVRATTGAKLFANAAPPLPAEWLCVFDAYCRAGKVSGNSYGEESESFDPLVEYGLDDDPARPPESNQRPQRIHDHLLEWRHGDDNPPTGHILSGPQAADYKRTTTQASTPIKLDWWSVEQPHRGLVGSTTKRTSPQAD